MSRMLTIIGDEYKNNNWLQAAIYFKDIANTIEKISDIIAYLADINDKTDTLSILFNDVLAKIKTVYFILIS